MLGLSKGPYSVSRNRLTHIECRKPTTSSTAGSAAVADSSRPVVTDNRKRHFRDVFYRLLPELNCDYRVFSQFSATLCNGLQILRRSLKCLKYSVFRRISR